MTQPDIKTFEGWMICDGDPEPRPVYHCEYCEEIIRQTTKPFYYDFDFSRIYCKKRCAVSHRKGLQKEAIR